MTLPTDTAASTRSRRLAVFLLLLSLLAFAYSLHVRGQDWKPAPPLALSQLVPSSSEPL